MGRGLYAGVGLLLLGAVACGPGPDPECGTGEVLEDGVCVPEVPPCADTRIGEKCVVIGVPADGCGSGFGSDGRGGCEPARPKTLCGTGELALPGDTSCQPVMACGAAPFGELPAPTGTLYVLASASAAGADGSPGAPYPSLNAAVAAAPSGGTILVGPGRYNGVVYITRPLTIRALCPAMVEIIAGFNDTAFYVDGADGTIISGFSITDYAGGVAVYEAEDVLLENLVMNGGDAGLLALSDGAATSVTLAHSLVDGASTGVFGKGISLTVRDSELRNMAPGNPGLPVGALLSLSGARTGRLVVEGSVFDENVGFAIAHGGGSARVTDSFIRGTRTTAGGDGGYGILVVSNESGIAPSSLTVEGSVLLDQGRMGVFAEVTDLKVDRTVIENVSDPSAVGDEGFCVGAYPAAGGITGVDITHSVIGGCVGTGVFVDSSHLSMFRTRIHDTGGVSTTGGVGQGVVVVRASAAASAALTDVVIERTGEAGALFVGVPARADGVLVEDVRPSNDGFGDGLSALSFLEQGSGAEVLASLEATGIDIRGTIRAGISVFAADLSLSRSALTCTGLDLDVEAHLGVVDGQRVKRDPALLDAGDNACGCENARDCKVETQGLSAANPPELPPPPMLQ